MTFQNPAIPPDMLPGHDDEESVATREVDGHEVLDDDADDTQVSSIDADRIASTADDADHD